MAEPCNIHRYPISYYDDFYLDLGEMMDASICCVSSHLVKTRKPCVCNYCGAPIKAGSFSLSEKGFLDGKPYLIHYCMDCIDDEIDVLNHKKDREEAYNEWVKRYEKSNLETRNAGSA